MSDIKDNIDKYIINRENPHESELIKRIYNGNVSEIMPPPESNLILTNKEKETLKESMAYRDDLKTRVEKLEGDKDECTDSLMDVKIKLSALEVKVLFLEKENDRLKYR